MKAIVTCESCGNRQTVERVISEPETFHVICHECEAVLRVQVGQAELLAAQAFVPPPSVAPAWG